MMAEQVAPDLKCPENCWPVAAAADQGPTEDKSAENKDAEAVLDQLLSGGAEDDKRHHLQKHQKVGRSECKTEPAAARKRVDGDEGAGTDNIHIDDSIFKD